MQRILKFIHNVIKLFLENIHR